MIINDFHDDSIIGINLAPECFNIAIHKNSKSLSIVVNDLVMLKVDNFKEGNIISRVNYYTKGENKESRGKVRKILHDLYDIDSLLSISDKLKSFINNQLDMIFHGELVLLEIVPSYGCYIISLGKTVLINGENILERNRSKKENKGVTH